MRQRNPDRLLQRRDALLNELRGLPNLMRGTLYEPERKCGRPSCTCATGGPRHATLRLNVTLGGRTRTRYVRRSERARVQALVTAYQRWRKLVEALTEVNLALLNAEPAEESSS